MAKDNEEAVPLRYIVEYAKSQPTQARRQAFVNLLTFWGENGGDAASVLTAIHEIQGGQVISASAMPKEFMPHYRLEDVASQLIEIVRQIDTKIATRQENWDWAHVMKVMIDEGIIMHVVPNKFDQLVCSMIPGKGRDTVRKNGDYRTIMKDREYSYHSWTDNSHLNPTQASNKELCRQIAAFFAPILSRKTFVSIS
jgi:hypothetical protein